MNIVLDFGGVVFRWRPLAVVRAALPRHVHSEADAAHWAACVFHDYSGDWADFDRGTVTVPDLAARIATRTGLAPAEVQAVVDAAAAELQPLPETVALIERWHAAGHRLFFLSNMPLPFASQFESAQFESSHGFMRLFESGVYSSHVQLIKPQPAIFAHAEQQFGMPGRDLLFFDDHPPNVQAARDCGWQAEVFSGAAQAGEVASGVTAHGHRSVEIFYSGVRGSAADHLAPP